MIIFAGVNHKTAHVKLRERLAFAEGTVPDALRHLMSYDDVNEAVILSTCNRVEIYADVKTGPEGMKQLTEFLKEWHGLDDELQRAMREHLICMQGKQAVTHLFEVVCSLDSMVLGEAQILGQVRQAFMDAQQAHTTGTVLTRLFKQALELGKQVRAQTEIGAKSLSVSTAAVSLVERVFDDIKNLSVVLLGTGQMGKLAATYLMEKGVSHLSIASRTFAHAQELADAIGGEAVDISELEEHIAASDVLLSCTSAKEYVIKRDVISRVRRARRGRPLLLMDIALPRDIDPACGDIGDVFLYDLDDLGGMMDDNAKGREAETTKVKEYVSQAVEKFLAWRQESSVTPTIKHMFKKASGVAAGERDRAAKALAAKHDGQLSDDDLKILDAMASSIASKILHGPTMRLRKHASDPDSLYYTEAARFLFGLDSNPSGKAHVCPARPGTLCVVQGGKECDVPEEKRCKLAGNSEDADKGTGKEAGSEAA
ncbi:MAG: glutamyl-tRNA reductase [Coriobacteriales bacterium]|jgi:glutamyl-tRNA reductase|nr:glutamyl-tRNA reductase [Coriobacteriales bacterium]